MNYKTAIAFSFAIWMFTILLPLGLFFYFENLLNATATMLGSLVLLQILKQKMYSFWEGGEETIWITKN